MINPNIREIILDVLMDYSKNGRFINVALHQYLERYQYLSKHDRAFISVVCDGTVERMIEIDYMIDQFSTIPVARMKPVIQNIMRMAVYQIKYMGSVPNGAAVNEAVLLAQSKGFYNLKGFVNGVLRNVVRNINAINYPNPKTNLTEYLSVTYSMPRWLVKYWSDQYGFDVTETMLKSFLEQRPTTVRLKCDHIKKKEILDTLISQGVTVKRAPYLPYAYNISGYNYLPALKAFLNGWIFPQDVSSMLVAEAASPHQGDYVIDLCAAPGGKSLHIADRMGGYGMVEARDLTADKVALISENVARADLINVKPMMMDALIFDESSVDRADIVLCDLPCSGLGVIGRKADIKYKVSLQKIEELALLQKQMLHNAASYVRPGGTLIYSTCTVNNDENFDNVRWFTENYPFHTESLDPYIPEELHRLTTKEGCLQLMPGIHESDGFFIARMKRDKA